MYTAYVYIRMYTPINPTVDVVNPIINPPTSPKKQRPRMGRSRAPRIARRPRRAPWQTAVHCWRGWSLGSLDPRDRLL